MVSPPESDARRRSRVLYLFGFAASSLEEEVAKGLAPSERLYCVPELRARGWNVSISDARHVGLAGRLTRWLRGLMGFVDVRTIRHIWANDIVVVKDDFSILLTLIARVLGKRIVYLDAMFLFPRRFWRRWSAWWNLRLANAVVSYSPSQAQLWAEGFGVESSRISVIRYGMDLAFYRPVTRARRDYVLAIGRDMGRDFATLIAALDGTGLGLKLITLPYLLPAGWDRHPGVEVLSRLSYEQLFELYAGAVAAVVPLKAGMNYPTGIRAVYEAGLLGVPVIATVTPVLQETFTHAQSIWFVSPEDPSELRHAIRTLESQPSIAEALARAARETVRSNLDIEDSADDLQVLLEAL